MKKPASKRAGFFLPIIAAIIQQRRNLHPVRQTGVLFYNDDILVYSLKV